MAEPTRAEVRKLAEEVSKRLADEGKLVEAGWAALAVFVIPPDAPDLQRSEMRRAFMAGAEHLFASIMGILDPGEEPTERDLRRLALIEKELAAFRAELRMDKPGGRA